MSSSPNRSSKSKKSAASQSNQSIESVVNMSDDLAVIEQSPSASSPLAVPEISETPPPLDSGEELEEEMTETEVSDFDEDSSETPDRLWQHPIPPPSEPRQYRAIGLVQGRYIASVDQFTQGTLLTSDGKLLDAVLLGRVMSLVKKHIDLDQEHLWVVYPRTRQNEGNLHVQIMGVWEPETLRFDEGQKSSETTDEENPTPSATQETASEETNSAVPDVQNGYFSIRGEVVYQSQEAEKYVIVKIRQAPRKDSDKPKFFKLKLLGIAGLRAVGHFWDLHVQLKEDYLIIQESHDIGMIPTKKRRPPFSPNNRRPSRRFSPGEFSKGSRPPFKPKSASESDSAPPPRREPLAKPMKRKAQSEE